MASLNVVHSAALPYLLSLPPPRTSGEVTWPVLCFLHGYDEGPPTPIGEALTRHGPLAPTSSALARDGFVVVAPQLPARGDLWHRHAGSALAVVRQVQALHGGDPQRTYLTGFSYGGNGVFDLAAAQADVWAALWPVDPTRVPATAPAGPVWMSSGEVSRRSERAFRSALRLGSPGADGAGDRVYEDAGADHVGTATAAYRNDRIYEWLLARQLPVAPR